MRIGSAVRWTLHEMARGEGENPAGVAQAVAAVARARRRPIDVEDCTFLPLGVFGQVLRLDERDVIHVSASRKLGREHIIAHELGHVVLGHRGLATASHAHRAVRVASPDLVGEFLGGGCRNDGVATAAGAEERQAERYALALVSRVSALGSYSPRLVRALG